MVAISQRLLVIGYWLLVIGCLESNKE